MAKKKKLEKFRAKITTEAEERDWDDLAYDIISIENLIAYEQYENDKQLEMLAFKLAILEEEKKNRVFSSFNMTYFLEENG